MDGKGIAAGGRVKRRGQLTRVPSNTDNTRWGLLDWSSPRPAVVVMSANDIIGTVTEMRGTSKMAAVAALAALGLFTATTISQSGSAVAASAATATGASTVAQAGRADGVSTASAGQASTFAQAGRADGTSSATAVGASTAAQAGRADGISTAQAAAPTATVPLYASLGDRFENSVRAWRTSRPEAAVAAYYSQSDGLSLVVIPGSDVSTWPIEPAFIGSQFGPRAAAYLVSTQVTSARAGRADGVSSAAAVGGSLFAGSGRADGASSATAGGASIASGAGRADGTSVASAVSAAIFGQAGRADGISSASAVGLGVSADPCARFYRLRRESVAYVDREERCSLPVERTIIVPRTQ